MPLTLFLWVMVNSGKNKVRTGKVKNVVLLLNLYLFSVLKGAKKNCIHSLSSDEVLLQNNLKYISLV